MKNNILITILFFAIIMIACNKKFERKTYYESGEVLNINSYQTKEAFIKNLNYSATSYYKNGDIHNHVIIENGLFEGAFYSYYQEEIIKSITHYNKGKKQGVEWCYSKKGELAEENFFIQDSLLIKMKSYSSGNNTLNHYYYVEGDSLKECGVLKLNKSNKVIEKESFYFLCEGEDTIKSSTYFFKIKTFTFDKSNKIDSILIGDIDKSYDFIDAKSVIKYEGNTNEIGINLPISKKGNNLVMGIIYINTTDGHEHFLRDFIFYKSFFVQ